MKQVENAVGGDISHLWTPDRIWLEIHAGKKTTLPRKKPNDPWGFENIFLFIIYGGFTWEGKIGVSVQFITQGTRYGKIWKMKVSYQHALQVAAGISQHAN